MTNTCAIVPSLLFFLHWINPTMPTLGCVTRPPSYLEEAVVFLRSTQDVPKGTAFIGFPHYNKTSVIDNFDPWSPHFVRDVESAAGTYGLVVIDDHHDYLAYPRNAWTMLHAAIKLAMVDGIVMVIDTPLRKHLLAFRKKGYGSA